MVSFLPVERNFSDKSLAIQTQPSRNMLKKALQFYYSQRLGVHESFARLF